MKITLILALQQIKVKQSRYRPELAYRVDRVIALPFRDLGARRGGWSAPRPGRFTPWKDLVHTLQEAGWAPAASIYTGCFIMFSVIANIYNKKTKGPTLMELFTATGKPNKFLLATRDVGCVYHG
jgi:hypothetical protein